MSAKFQVEAVFTVEGRGTILQGQVVDGAITTGMSASVPTLTARLVIHSVDAIHGPSIPVGSLGLALREGATGTPAELRPLIEGRTLAFEQESTGRWRQPLTRRVVET